jgi:hypothetical protein
MCRRFAPGDEAARILKDILGASIAQWHFQTGWKPV